MSIGITIRSHCGHEPTLSVHRSAGRCVRRMSSFPVMPARRKGWLLLHGLAAIALLLLWVPGPTWAQGHQTAESFSRRQIPTPAVELASSSVLPKMAAFVSAYVACLMFCIPGSSSFDYTAGYVYGFFTGVAVVAIAKGTAAVLTFLLVRALRESRAMQLLQTRTRSRSGPAAQLAARIRTGVKSDCFKFCLLARLAPLQASFVNYILSVSGVPLTTYIASSIIGMLPPICNNVYTGVAAATVQATISGGADAGGWASSIAGVVLVAISIFSSAGLLKQLARGQLVDDEEQEAYSGSDRDASSEGNLLPSDVESPTAPP